MLILVFKSGHCSENIMQLPTGHCSFQVRFAVSRSRTPALLFFSLLLPTCRASDKYFSFSFGGLNARLYLYLLLYSYIGLIMRMTMRPECQYKHNSRPAHS